MPDNALINKLELHYFFSEDDMTHSMDAVVRNRCEHELLQIISTVSKELNIQIKVETEAYDEGGLVEFYTFIGTAEGQAILTIANLAVTVLGILISRIPQRKSKLDKIEQRLSIEEKKNNLEIHKLNLRILQNELSEKKINSTNINIEKIEFILSKIQVVNATLLFFKFLF